jgi:hypothetical protein
MKSALIIMSLAALACGLPAPNVVIKTKPGCRSLIAGRTIIAGELCTSVNGQVSQSTSHHQLIHSYRTYLYHSKH